MMLMDPSTYRLVKFVAADGTLVVTDHHARLRWRLPADKAFWLRWL
jgi:hypothetical protein